MANEPINVIVRQRGARTTGAAIKGIGSQASLANKSATLLKRTLLTLGVGVGIGLGIKTLANFSQEMSTVKAITKATDDQFQALREQAKTLGATTRFSASEAAEGMTFLARAGFDVDKVLGSIGGTLNLAQAGALGLGEAADISSNILSGFRLEVDQMERVVNVLAETATSTNTTVLELGEGMKFVAPVAAGLGVSIEETAAAMGVLANNALKGSLGGTGLRKILSKLARGGADLENALSRAGLTLADVDVRTVGLTGAMQSLKKAGVGVEEAFNIFQERGGTAASVLIENVALTKEFDKNLRGVTDTAERIAKVMDENLNGALLATKSAFEAVVIAFGDLGAQTFLTRFFFGLADALRSVANNLDLVVRSAGAVLLAFLPLVAPRIVNGFISLALGIKGLAASFLSMAAAATTVTGIMTIMTGGLLALVAAGGALFIFRDKIKLTSDSVATLGDFFKALKGEAEPVITALKEGMVEFFSDVERAIQTFQESFSLSVEGIILSIADIGDITIATVKGIQAFLDFDAGIFSSITERLADVGFRLKLLAIEIADNFKFAASIVGDGETAEGRFLEAFNASLERATLRGIAERTLAEAKRFALARQRDEGKTPEEVAASVKTIGEAFEESTKKQSVFAKQFEDVMTELSKSFNEFGTEVGFVLVNAFQGAEDALVQFVQTGKLEFSALIDSIIEDLIRLAVRNLILGNILDLFTGDIPSGTAATPAGSPQGPILSVFDPPTTFPTITNTPLPSLPGQGGARAGALPVFAPQIQVNVEGNKLGEEGGRDIAKEVGIQAKRALDEAMVKFTVDQSRPGGMLSSSGKSL